MSEYTHGHPLPATATASSTHTGHRLAHNTPHSLSQRRTLT
jgi:hypothetical protein